MLQNLDDQVRDCKQRAAECAEQARIVNPRERDEWLSLHDRYLALARELRTGTVILIALLGGGTARAQRGCKITSDAECRKAGGAD